MKRHSEHQDASDGAFDALLASALSRFQAKQQNFLERLAGFESWSIEDEESTLVFASSGGEAERFRIVPVGSYLPDEEDWAWAWAEDAFSDACRREAARMKELSDQTGYPVFSLPSFKADREDVSQICALALHQFDGIGIFNVKSHTPWTYYVVLGQ